MKKLLLLGIAAVIALVLIVFGPVLVDLYRLDRFISASNEAYVADGGPWPHLTDVCIMCHGDQGNSLHQSYPSLAGQPAAYLATQLRNFASGQRANPNMGPLAMTLSEAEIKLVSEYFARQPVSANQFFEPDVELREQGRQLVKTQACAGCHGDAMMGRDQFPRLAGQGYDYLLAQMDAYAAGTRLDPTGTMNGLAAAASAEQRRAFANYLASLVPREDVTNRTSGHLQVH